MSGNTAAAACHVAVYLLSTMYGFKNLVSPHSKLGEATSEPITSKSVEDVKCTKHISSANGSK